MAAKKQETPPEPGSFDITREVFERAEEEAKVRRAAEAKEAKAAKSSDGDE